MDFWPREYGRWGDGPVAGTGLERLGASLYICYNLLSGISDGKAMGSVIWWTLQQDPDIFLPAKLPNCK